MTEKVAAQEAEGGGETTLYVLVRHAPETTPTPVAAHKSLTAAYLDELSRPVGPVGAGIYYTTWPVLYDPTEDR